MGAVASARPVRCPKCGRSFANEMDLKYHDCSGTVTKSKSIDEQPVGVG